MLISEKHTGNKALISKKVVKTYFNLKEKQYTSVKVNSDPAETTKATLRPVLLSFFEDALNGKGKFDLVFEGIAKCSKAKYLIFSSKEVNSYRAPVKVEMADEFIKEVTSNPLRYYGEKLDINWGVNDSNEVIYEAGKLRARN
jgi:hypothetical protein